MTDYYHRPDDVRIAAQIIHENEGIPIYVYYLERKIDSDSVFVDLQNCGLDKIESTEDQLIIGSSVSLEQILEIPNCPFSLKKAIKLDEQLNRRNMLSLADILLEGDGSSPILTVLLAMDAKIIYALDESEMKVGDFLALKVARLISAVQIPINASTVYETISSTPSDRPLVGAALTKWESGRIRLALGGAGKVPLLVVDGKGIQGIEKAAASAYLDAGDFRASKEYRSKMAQILTTRCVGKI